MPRRLTWGVTWGLSWGRSCTALALPLILSACAGLETDAARFTARNDALVVEGAIYRSTIAAFRDASAAHPGIRKLVLQNISGSADDDANLELARMVRAQGFTTIVPADGMVASGGTDLFLAGRIRQLEPGACVGVHSWGDGIEQGRDVPREAEVHQIYLEYYDAMGVPRDFYWYTLEVAPVEGIHWMTAREAARYDMTTGPVADLGSAAQCDLR